MSSGVAVSDEDRAPRRRGSKDGRSELGMEKDGERNVAADVEGGSKAPKATMGLAAMWAATDMTIVGSMMFNYLSSTGIVSANKYLFTTVGFSFGTTLTFIHFIVTTIGLLLCAQVNLFTPKKLDISKAAWLAFFNMSFVVFSNLSLQYNSVGFYQVMKHMTVASVVAIEALIYKKYLDRSLWGPLALVILGVSLTGATDFKLNKVGFIFATLNIFSTSFYQIWCGTLQKSLEADALQLQLYIAPLAALFVIPFMPVLDNYSFSDPSSILHYDFTANAFIAIAVTGIFAFCVNVSIFMVIGKTSAVTYNVLGHFKTCTLLLCDYVFFGRPFEWKNFTGIVITLLGVVTYSHVKMIKSQQTATTAERK